MRKTKFEDNEYYHIYNRGTDKRSITTMKEDSDRFVGSIIAFNSREPIGSIYLILSGSASKDLEMESLVEIIAYCFNPNHFHLILKQIEDGGISKFMHKFGTGFTRYFNDNHYRSGSLFQGRFKARHIESDYDLLRMSTYVNLNYKVHQLSGSATKLVRSSWDEYRGNAKKQICSRDIILDQFSSIKEYTKFAQETVKEIVKERKLVDNSEIEKMKKEFYGYYFD